MVPNKIMGNTTLTGLIGNPVSHSISPLIHNHAFAKLNLNYSYIPLGIAPEGLEGLVTTLKGLNWAGANVTIPYKSDVIAYCDKISPLSELTGAVNTLYFDGEKKLCGTTTDADGFLQALQSENFDIANKKVLFLGNGGTSRTLAMVLAHKKLPKSITIAGRNSEKVTPLVEEIKEKTSFPVNQILFSDEDFTQTSLESDIIVNCTPIGMHPKEGSSPLTPEQLSETTYIFDAIYNPGETELLKIAKEKGCLHQNGLKMLLFQGLESFKYWTGEEALPELFDLDELQKIVTPKR